jgi:hypothetical protein
MLIANNIGCWETYRYYMYMIDKVADMDFLLQLSDCQFSKKTCTLDLVI